MLNEDMFINALSRTVTLPEEFQLKVGSHLKNGECIML